PERANPIPLLDAPGLEPDDQVWKNNEGVWMTVFPPAPGFDGYESCKWDGLTWYERECSAEEAALLDAHQTAAQAEEEADLTAFAEAERDKWFEKLLAEL